MVTAWKTWSLATWRSTHASTKTWRTAFQFASTWTTASATSTCTYFIGETLNSIGLVLRAADRQRRELASAKYHDSIVINIYPYLCLRDRLAVKLITAESFLVRQETIGFMRKANCSSSGRCRNTVATRNRCRRSTCCCTRTAETSPFGTNVTLFQLLRERAVAEAWAGARPLTAHFLAIGVSAPAANLQIADCSIRVEAR